MESILEINNSINSLLEQASQIYKQNFPNTTSFERAIFVSWYCSIGDCTFCYMSTQQNKISEPRKARRRLDGILAEAFLCKKLGWGIEFISGGVESYTMDELEFMLKNIHAIYGKKLWLNIGIMDKSRLQRLMPYLEGVTGTVETINPAIHEQVCPSKPIKPIEFMFKAADELGLKKAMTIIIGLGETIGDFDLLKEFIEKHKVDRITFYALNPLKGTSFENTKGPEMDYFLEWIARTRIAFPKIEIIAGMWVNRVDSIPALLRGGANYLTKFPAIKLFGSEHARQFEENANAEREFKGTMTNLPEIDLGEIENMDIDNSLKEGVKRKAVEYVESMKKKQLIVSLVNKN